MSQEKQQRLKKCRQCFNYNAPKSKKCKFCGNKFKVSGKWSLVDKVRQVLRIDRGFAMSRTETSDDAGKFFTTAEIETLLRFEDISITVFLTLDSINFLNENALMELGEMLTAINKD